MEEWQKQDWFYQHRQFFWGLAFVCCALGILMVEVHIYGTQAIFGGWAKPFVGNTTKATYTIPRQGP